MLFHHCTYFILFLWFVHFFLIQGLTVLFTLDFFVLLLLVFLLLEGKQATKENMEKKHGKDKSINQGKKRQEQKTKKGRKKQNEMKELWSG